LGRTIREKKKVSLK